MTTRGNPTDKTETNENDCNMANHKKQRSHRLLAGLLRGQPRAKRHAAIAMHNARAAKRQRKAPRLGMLEGRPKSYRDDDIASFVAWSDEVGIRLAEHVKVRERSI